LFLASPKQRKTGSQTINIKLNFRDSFSTLKRVPSKNETVSIDYKCLFIIDLLGPAVVMKY